MQFLLHRIPFCRQGQIRRADGEYDTLSVLVVFLPQEQPFNFNDISESVKHDNIMINVNYMYACMYTSFIIDDCTQV